MVNQSNSLKDEVRSDGVAAINPLYREALSAAVSRLEHEGELPRNPDAGVVVSQEFEGIVLSVLVESEQNLVHAARHRGGRTLAEAAVLDRFCALGEGDTVQEWSDHGTIRLEAGLRDWEMQPPVDGIVIQETVEPVYELCNRLVRGIRARLNEMLGDPPSRSLGRKDRRSRWTDAGPEEKVRLANWCLARYSNEFGLGPGEMYVVGTEKAFRVAVDFSSDVDVWVQPRLMRKLEARMHLELDDRLELIAPARSDKNRIRRL